MSGDTMRRRDFVALAGAAVCIPRAAKAQQTAAKVYRVGWIYPNAPVSDMAGPDPVQAVARAFVHALRDLGYIEGRNLILERRSAEGRPERYRELVAELLERRVDVLVTATDDMALAAKQLTATAPIVMAACIDPVGTGLVANLARPGGNITGFTTTPGFEIETKRLQMLKEVHPRTERVAFFAPNGAWETQLGKHLQASATTLGLTLLRAEFDPARYSDGLAQLLADRPDAILASSSGAHYVHRDALARFALEHRLPGIYWYRENAVAGGLVSYGASIADQYRRAAGYVDRILKGARPAELPVQQPTRFDLVVNLKTARALGLTMPQTLLAFADEVIE
jgi:putative ABC transport system substrate-binding protein